MTAFPRVWKTPDWFQWGGLGVSALPQCRGQTGLQLEHLPWEEAAAVEGRREKLRSALNLAGFPVIGLRSHLKRPTNCWEVFLVGCCSFFPKSTPLGQLPWSLL